MRTRGVAVAVVALVLTVGACAGAPATPSVVGAGATQSPDGGGAVPSLGGGESAGAPTAAPPAESGEGSGSAAGVACGLLTEEQVQDFSGFPLLEARPEGANACRWVLDAGSAVPDRHAVTIEVKRSGGRAEFDTFSALEAVPGIGDGAVKAGGNTDGTVWAVRGDSLVKLTYALPVTVQDADPLVLPLLELALNGLQG